MEQNIQLYGRNDMVMLQNEKIYGSLGLAEKYIVKTKQGTPPLLLDSSLKSKFLGMNIYGKSTQETTDGINVYAGGSITTTWENAEDGSINVNAGNLQFLLQCGDVFQSGGFLSFDSDINVPIEAVVSFKGYDVNNWGKEATRLYIKAGYNKVILPKYNFIDGQEKVKIQIRKNNVSDSLGTPYTFTLSNIMVKAGQEEHEYEPYTGGIPSPNPDYPQEIQSLGSGGSIDVKVLRCNVFDSSYRNTYDVISGSGCEVEENNGVFTLTCTKINMYVWNVLNNGQSYTGNSSLCGIMAIPSVSKISVKLSNVVFKKNYITFYDENKVAIKTISYSNNVFTQKVIDGAKYFTIRFGKGDAVVGETYETTVMVNYGDPMDYIPYTEQSFTIQTPNGLHGIPVSSGGNYTDESGQQWVCDEIDFERGVYVRNIVSRTFDGSGNIISDGILNDIFRCRGYFPEIPNMPSIIYICDKFVKGVGHMEKFNTGYRYLYLWIDTSRLNRENSTLDDVKKFLNNNPITVYAEREIPIETLLSTEELTAYKALHSNYPTTIVDNSEQAEMSVVYKSFENV